MGVMPLISLNRRGQFQADNGHFWVLSGQKRIESLAEL
jgi:hypothetical protein